MLFEGITYADDFPLNIAISTITEDPLHYHVDIEFIYVLQGGIRLRSGCNIYDLREGDIFTSAGHEVHRLTALTPDNVVAQIQISTHYFSRYFPNLSTNVYRTYSKKPNDRRHDHLRGLLLQVLLKYALKSFNYKSECTFLIVDTIKHLDKHFNLFAFDQTQVVSFDRSNPVAVERISRIYTYIYQYYADNITLEDLSRMEHLSSFYLSHLIKSFTGMNFRELLCFARVEWSEIRLLESSSKISQIARDVGFSTTAYYEKYFEKWFHCSPQVHRETSLPLIKSELRPVVAVPLSQERAIAVIKNAHTAYNLKQGAGAVIASRNLDAEINVDRPPLFQLDKQLIVKITLEDYRALGFQLLGALADLAPARVALLTQPQDPEEELRALVRLLRSGGMATERRDAEPREPRNSAAYDSIAAPIHLFRAHLRADRSPLERFLRDPGPAKQILQGQDSLLTACGVRKPAFFACQFLSQVRGDVIYQSNQCCVVRLPGAPPRGDGAAAPAPSYVVLAYNANDAIQNLCRTSADRLQVKNTLNDFKDELNISATLNLRSGAYSMAKYSMDKESNIFAYMAALDFQDEALSTALPPDSFSGFPSLEVYIEDVRTLLSLHFSLKGAGLQIAVIKPRKGIR